MPTALAAELLDEHAFEAAFLWSTRDAAAVAPHHDLASLGDVDERLEAHLDGLRVGGDRGVAAAERLLDPDEPGTVFTLATLVLERQDAARIEAAFELAAGSRAAARAAVGALAWLPFDRAREPISRLLAHGSPAARQRIGLAASAAHRRDPGEALSYAVASDDAPLHTRGVRACGELGRADLRDAVREALGAEDDERRFWAGASAMLLGEEGAARTLWSLADAGGAFAARACALAVRKLDVREARAKLEGLGAAPALARAATAGAGALGDPALVPWLLERMAEPTLARVAAEAFAAITGAAVTGRLAAAAPAGFTAGPTDDPGDEDVAMDPDWALRWPAREAIVAWWSEREGSFRRGTRYVRGAPLTDDALQRELELGSQRARAAAAFELGLRRPGRPLLEVRARAARQLAGR